MKNKNNFINILLVVILLVGLSLLLYPSVSDYWNSFHQTKAISDYTETVDTMDQEEQERMWDAAVAYNEELGEAGTRFHMEEEQKKKYEQQLNVGNLGIMGYIDIPKINCSLPIYHGVDDTVLQVAVGHLEWSSLPVGGEGSHCVLSGHRGLPSAKLFTNLDQLIEGDTFMLRILNETLTYEVDQIRIVEPKAVEELTIEMGKDYCTLVTCTPYGINTHRLLVRGHRIENLKVGSAYVVADAVQIEPLWVAPIVAIPILLLCLILVLIPRRKHGGDSNEE